MEYVRKTLKMAGVQNKKVNEINFIKGWIPESFNQYDDSPVSLLNVDVDIYEPTKAILTYFWPLMQQGGIILLDEYDTGDDLIKWPGAKKAIDEFCDKNDCQVEKHFTGRSFISKQS